MKILSISLTKIEESQITTFKGLYGNISKGISYETIVSKNNSITDRYSRTQNYYPFADEICDESSVILKKSRYNSVKSPDNMYEEFSMTVVKIASRLKFTAKQFEEYIAKKLDSTEITNLIEKNLKELKLNKYLRKK